MPLFLESSTSSCLLLHSHGLPAGVTACMVRCYLYCIYLLALAVFYCHGKPEHADRRFKPFHVDTVKCIYVNLQTAGKSKYAWVNHCFPIAESWCFARMAFWWLNSLFCSFPELQAFACRHSRHCSLMPQRCFAAVVMLTGFFWPWRFPFTISLHRILAGYLVLPASYSTRLSQLAL